MRTITLSILSAAIIATSPAMAKNNAQQGTENQVGTAASDDGASKKVCRRLAGTGSRMTPRVCLTKEEWKQVEQVK
jgi:predicted transglutaminase-like cysteine proteinase